MSKKLWILMFVVTLFFSYSTELLSNDCYIPTHYPSNENNYKLPRIMQDSCIVADKLRRTIFNYIKYENENIYNEEFISSFLETNERQGVCYFPRTNEDVKLYYDLGDTLLKKSKIDERAMKLLIELYLAKQKSAELSEYYGLILIPQAAIENINYFVKIISRLPERDINQCINKLKYIKNDTDIKRLIDEIDNIDNKEFLNVKDKIKQKLCSIYTE